MENKIQALADKIYRDGVEKGNEEAQRIVSEAQEKAKQLVAQAQEEAQAILASAKKQAGELEDNTKSELKLFAGQALNALKTEVTNLLTNQTIGKAVEGFTADKDALNKFIVALAGKWVESEPIVVSAPEADKLKKYFAANAKALLDKGVTIKQVNGKSALFSISPADGSYKVDFGKEEFENYFKDFLRPQLIEMLF